MGLFDSIKNVLSQKGAQIDTAEVEVEKEVDRTSVPLVQADSGGSAPDQQINQITSFIDGSAVDGSESDPATQPPNEALETSDDGSVEPLAVELENVQITSYQLGVLDNDAATDGNAAATDDLSMTLNFERVPADGASPDDEESTLISAEDQTSGEMTPLGSGAEMEIAEVADESDPGDLDEL